MLVNKARHIENKYHLSQGKARRTRLMIVISLPPVLLAGLDQLVIQSRGFETRNQCWRSSPPVVVWLYVRGGAQRPQTVGNNSRLLV